MLAMQQGTTHDQHARWGSTPRWALGPGIDGHDRGGGPTQLRTIRQTGELDPGGNTIGIMTRCQRHACSNNLGERRDGVKKKEGIMDIMGVPRRPARI